MFKKIYFVIIIGLFLLNLTASQPTEFYQEFIAKTLSNPQLIINYLDVETSDRVSSLGISYRIDYPKFLIGNMLDKNIREFLSNNPDKYQLIISNLDEGFSRLEVNSEYGKLDFYFKAETLISRADYYSRNWLELDSDFFRFKFPVDNPPNTIAINKLDSFAESVLTILNCHPQDVNKLKQEKIYYLLCPDDATIQEVTSFQTRGIYFLNQDYVVSKFPAHYHEICHLLINFKLQNLPLFTHPFLQEGFAVALGGRGGKNAEIILDIGQFLQNSVLINYANLFSSDNFRYMDASISYPIAGLYTRFLLETLDIDSYLRLYLRFSNATGNFTSIDSKNLPDETRWQTYLATADFSTAYPSVKATNFRTILNSDSLFIAESELLYDFKTFSPINFDFDDGIFILNKNGRYTLTCNEKELNILDNATGNLIATYVSGFSLAGENITEENGLWHFLIKKEVLQD